jgi:hypothetical protein
MQSLHSSTSSNVFRYLLVIPYFYTLCPRTLCIFHWTRLFLISPFSFWKRYSFFLFSRLPLLPQSVSFWQYSFFSQFPFYGSVSSLLPSFLCTVFITRFPPGFLSEDIPFLFFSSCGYCIPLLFPVFFPMETFLLYITVLFLLELFIFSSQCFPWHPQSFSLKNVVSVVQVSTL